MHKIKIKIVSQIALSFSLKHIVFCFVVIRVVLARVVLARSAVICLYEDFALVHWIGLDSGTASGKFDSSGIVFR